MWVKEDEELLTMLDKAVEKTLAGAPRELPNQRPVGASVPDYSEYSSILTALGRLMQYRALNERPQAVGRAPRPAHDSSAGAT